MTRKTRRKIDAGMKAKIALEALREQATGGRFGARDGVRPNKTYAWKKQLRRRGARFHRVAGRDAETARER